MEHECGKKEPKRSSYTKFTKCHHESEEMEHGKKRDRMTREGCMWKRNCSCAGLHVDSKLYQTTEDEPKSHLTSSQPNSHLLAYLASDTSSSGETTPGPGSLDISPQFLG